MSENLEGSYTFTAEYKEDVSKRATNDHDVN